MEKPAKGKHSSLFGPLVSYEENRVLRIRLLGNFITEDHSQDLKNFIETFKIWSLKNTKQEGQFNKTFHRFI